MIQENKNYDIFKGTSQHDRYKKEVLPSYVKIDGRSLADLLQFVSQYANLINFFSTNNLNSENENWSSFFNKDNLIILVSISNYNINSAEDYVQGKLNKAHNTKDQGLRINILNELINPILTIGESLDYIRKNIQRDELTSDLIFDISNAIQGDLRHNLMSLYQYKVTLNWEDDIENRFSSLKQLWGGTDVEFQINDDPMTISNMELEEIKSIFHSFFFTIHHTIEKSKELVESLMSDMKNNKPHIALYMSFLKLFKYAQDLQNELPQKHLDFYYRDVLKQKEKEAEPDEVLVNINLSAGVNSFYLKKETALDGGKNSDNEPLFYNTTSPVRLTSSKILKLKTLFKSLDTRCHQQPNSKFVTGLYSTELNRQKKGGFRLIGNQAVFGEEQVLKSENEKTLEESRIGFLISSPILSLESGKRKIQFELKFEENSYNQAFRILEEASDKNEESIDETIYKVFSTAFNISISQEKSIKKIENYEFRLNDEKSSWIFSFILDSNDAAFCNLKKNLPEDPKCDNPFISVHLKHECSLFLYSLVAELKLKNIRINTKSEKLSDFVLYNTLGELNPNKPFEIFGTIPQNNGYFVVGHREAFTKNIDRFKLAFDWFSSPISQGGTEKYFEGYKNKKLNGYEKSDLLTESYQLKPATLINGLWVDSKKNAETNPLFSNKVIEGISISDEYSDKIVLDIDLKEMGQVASKLEKSHAYTRNSNDGFVRFNLVCPEFGFGHNSYAKLLSETVLKNAKIKKKEQPIELLKEPFSPLAINMELEYESSVEAISITSGSNKEGDIEFYHLNPFGYKKIELKSSEHEIALMETDESQGNLFLGLDSYPYRGEISLLFLLNEEEVNDENKNNEKVRWSYLSDNIWMDFSKNNVLDDTTNGFINSGVIQLRIPKLINKNNTLLNDDLFWFKASVNSGLFKMGKVEMIHENGVHAVWDKAVESDHIANKLPKYTVTKTKNIIPEIGDVNQTTASFGGRMKESSQHFYTRLSERLRHKNRAITALDYEELILQKFPHVYKVKCFVAQHTLSDNYKSIENVILPGTVRIAVVADSQLLINKFRPKVSTQTLIDIEQYLLKFTSPFAQIYVNNPFYEQIRVICKVIFNNFESDSYNEMNLQNDIIGFLNPWMHNFKVEEEFGKSMFKSEVLSFIQNLNYVEFVTEFSMIKILEQEGEYTLYDTAREDENSEEIKVIYPWSILVSSREHDITIINDPSYESALPRGITNMTIETDFIISN